MATDYQDVLDSPKVYDGQQSFIGGVNSFDAPELLAPNAIAYAENMDVSFDGKIKNRSGVQTFTGTDGQDFLGHHSATGRVLAITQFNPLKINANTAYVYVIVSLEATNALQIDMFDPSNTWAGSPFAVTPFTGSTADFMPIGNTLYAIWGSNLYKLTSAAGSAPVFAASVVSGSSTGFPNLCPNAQFGTVHRNRLFIWGNTDVGSSDQDISVSAVLAFENFDLVNRVFQAGTIDEGPVTCCQSWFGNNILVFKQKAIYVVDTTDPVIANWPIQLVTRSTGCVARNSVRLVGNDVFFLGTDGVYSVGRVYAVESQAQVSPPVSRPIGDLFNTLGALNLATTQYAYATTLGNKYILSFPSAYSSPQRCDTTVVYNLLTQAWDGRYSFPNATNSLAHPQCYGKINNGIYVGMNVVAGGSGNAPNVLAAPVNFVSGSVTDYSATDRYSAASANVNFTWILDSKSAQFESSTSPKKGSHAFYFADGINSVTDVTHNTIVDKQVRDTLGSTILATTGQNRIISDLQQYDGFFSLQHRISGYGSISIKGSGAAAWLEATPRETFSTVSGVSTALLSDASLGLTTDTGLGITVD